ncbi:MFS transporter, partial [Streptomyces palmae]
PLRLARSALAWQVTLFMGLQSMLAYVAIAWMPTIFTDHGMSKGTAGLVFAFSTLTQMAGSFVVPLLAGRMRRQRLLAVVVSLLLASGTVGLLLAPVAGAWLWAALIGVGQGGTVGLALTMMVLRTSDAHTAARLSGMAQTWGYLLAAAGPLTLGAVHQATGDWNLPIVLMLAVCGALALLGLGAGRDRRIGTPTEQPA